MINGLQGTAYEARLEELSMRTLKERRKRLDLVQTFKIIKGYNRQGKLRHLVQVGRRQHPPHNKELKLP